MNVRCGLNLPSMRGSRCQMTSSLSHDFLRRKSGAEVNLKRRMSSHNDHRRTATRMAAAGADSALEEGRSLYLSGDRMGALRKFEEALSDPNVTLDQKQEALYSSTCCHATFGDVELAKILLRQGILEAGLDWDDATTRDGWVPLVASTQCKIQLRTFSDQILRQAEKSSSSSSSSSSSGGVAQGSSGTAPSPTMTTRPQGGLTRAQQAQAAQARAIKAANSTQSIFAMRDRVKEAADSGDMSDFLQTDLKDDLDTSLGAIVRRVAILLLVMVVSGVGLFYLGLEFLFPK